MYPVSCFSLIGCNCCRYNSRLSLVSRYNVVLQCPYIFEYCIKSEATVENTY